MMDEVSLFGALPIPKRRRTTLRTVPNRAWQYDSQPEDSSVLSDEAEVAQALQKLASEASFPEQKPELEEEESGHFEERVYEPEFKRRRDRKGNTQQRSRSRVEANLDESRDRAKTFRAGQAGVPNSSVAHQTEGQRQETGGASFGLGQFSSVLPGGAYPGVLPANASLPNGVLGRTEPASQPKDAFGSQDLRAKLAFKRCASHVYIARFIELHTNKNRIQQSQQRQVNGFGPLHRGDTELPERVIATSATFSRQPTADSLPTLPAPQPQELPVVSSAHQFLGPHHFPASAGLQVHGPGLPDLPPAYAHLLSQQGAFPFMPPGLHMDTFTAQQQAAAAQALAGFSGMFPPHLMFPAALSSQLAGGGPANGSSPVPSLPPSMAKANMDGSAKLMPHSNGAGIKQEDGMAATLMKLGLAPGPNGSSDLERLRAMLPPGFFEQRAAALNQGPLVDALKAPPLRGDQLPLEAWGPGLPTRM